MKLIENWERCRTGGAPAAIDPSGLIMFPTIVELQPRQDFHLLLRYDDGTSGLIDFRPVIKTGGVFAELGNEDFFHKVQLGEKGRFIVWPGNIDFCADALKEELADATATSHR